VGDFDERIFLEDDAEEEIGTPAAGSGIRDDGTGELSERMQQWSNLQAHVSQVNYEAWHGLFYCALIIRFIVSTF